MNTINFKGIGIRPLKSERSDNITTKEYPGGTIIKKDFLTGVKVAESENLEITRDSVSLKPYLSKDAAGKVRYEVDLPRDFANGKKQGKFIGGTKIYIGEFKGEKGFKQYAMQFFKAVKDIENLTCEKAQTLAKKLFIR